MLKIYEEGAGKEMGHQKLGTIQETIRSVLAGYLAGKGGEKA